MSKKKKTREAVKAADEAVTALKDAGVIAPDAKVEVRVHGQRRKVKKQQRKPR
jgi:hypothetical protein